MFGAIPSEVKRRMSLKRLPSTSSSRPIGHNFFNSTPSDRSTFPTEPLLPRILNTINQTARSGVSVLRHYGRQGYTIIRIQRSTEWDHLAPRCA